MVILSGIPPGPSGTGGVISFLVREASIRKKQEVRFVFGPEASLLEALRYLIRGQLLKAASLMSLRTGIPMRNALKEKAVIETRDIVLIHPQSMGFRETMEFIDRRTDPVWLYLMDSSYFCVRSYNYIPDEKTACLRCLGGDFGNIERYGCVPFPKPDAAALEYVQKLMEYVRTGRVTLISQNKSQAALASKHFGEQVSLRTIGIWAEDWDERRDSKENRKGVGRKRYDVVFHGNPLPAKGATWALCLAHHCPKIRFLFPFPRVQAPGKWGNLGNCEFSPLQWNTGLKEAVCDADLVLVPSLWSAPIEGALVKSLAIGRAVAVVQNPSSFSSEIPEELVLRLPPDPENASEVLCKTLSDGWAPPMSALESWLTHFRESNRTLFERICTIGEASK